MWHYYQYMRQVIENRCGKEDYALYGEQVCDYFLTVMTAEEYVYGWYPNEDDVYLYIESLKEENVL